MSKKFALMLLVLLVTASLYAAVTSDIAPRARIKQAPTVITKPVPSLVRDNSKIWHFQEGFEGTFPPAGWTVYDVLDPSTTWLQSPNTPHSGSYCAFCYWSSSSAAGEDWLVTPQFTVQANDSCYFWFRGYITGWPPDQTWLMLSTTDNQVASFTTELWTQAEPNYSTTWAQYAVDLTPYAGQQVYLAFKHADDYGDGVLLDDVAIGCEYVPTALDVALQSIDTPATVIVPPSVPFHGVWTIKNLGIDPVSDFATYYEIYDSTGTITLYGTAVNIITPDSLAHDSTRQFTAATDFTPNPATFYRVKAYIALPGDGHPENDTLRFTFRTYDLLAGTVTDDNNSNAPLQDVIITATGPATYVDTTDAGGAYSFPSMLDGSYTLTARLTGYTTETLLNVAVMQIAPNVTNIAMGYPVLSHTPVDSFYITMRVDTTDNTTWGLTINNTGTRDLNYSMSWPVLVKGGKALGDSLWGLDVGTPCAETQCLGVEYLNGYIWITGGASGADPNKLYKINAGTGALEATYDQSSAAGWGWRDLATDGTYLYGSDDGTVKQIDPATGLATGVSLTGPTNPNRALAYNPSNDHFYTANFNSNIWEFDRSGTVINTWANTLSIYGLAYDGNNPAGPSLWAWSQDGTTLLQASRFDLNTGVFAETFAGNSFTGAGMAGGCTFTTQQVPGKAVLLAAYQDDIDRLVAHEIRDDNVTWLNFAPASGTVAAGNNGNCVVTFNTAGLTDLTTYAANLNIMGNFTTAQTPVYLHTDNTTGVAGQPVKPLSYAFALNANHPNPAGNRTTFDFSLPKAQDYSLHVYNIAGQLVRSFSGKGTAGPNRVDWNTGKTGNGIYFYQLMSGGQSATRKLVVIK